MYYIMRCPVYTNEQGEQLAEIENAIEVGDIWDWGTGVVFDEDEKNSIPNPIHMEVEFFNGYSGLPPEYDDINACVMSERLANALTNAGVDNIDYYPAILTNKESGQTYSYLAYNIIGLVSAVDFDASHTRVYDNKPVINVSIYDLVLDEQKIQDHLLFRLAESSNTIIVHESVKQSIESAGIDTLKFIKPEDYMHL